MSDEKVSTVPTPSSATFVVATDGLNADSFSPAWFLQAGIVKPEELTGQAVVTKGIVELTTPDFKLQIIGGRLQFTIKNPLSEDAESLSVRIIGGFFKQLPSASILAIGANFEYYLGASESVDYAGWNKKNLISPLATRCFGESGEAEFMPRFGSYFSVNYNGVRMKVDAKPVSVVGRKGSEPESHQETKELIKMSFNFHLGAGPENPITDTSVFVGRYADFLKKTADVVTQLDD